MVKDEVWQALVDIEAKLVREANEARDKAKERLAELQLISAAERKEFVFKKDESSDELSLLICLGPMGVPPSNFFVFFLLSLMLVDTICSGK